MLYREYQNQKIYCNLKVARIFFLIALIAGIAGSILLGVRFYYLKFEVEFADCVTLIIAVIGLNFVFPLACLRDSSGKRLWDSRHIEPDGKKIFKKDLGKIEEIIILSSPVFIGLLSWAMRATVLMDGIPYEISVLPAGFWMFIGHIFTILAFVKMRKEITAEDRAKAKETKILAEEERKKEKEDERCRNLLSETGKLFFIKYYEQLKNWNPTDIFDIIEENYSEEIKRKRISFAKEIFKQNLEVRALEEIADSTQNVVDEETIHKAQEILNRKIQ